MTKTDTVNIDGQDYDASTGLPVTGDQPSAAKPVAKPSSATVHATATALHASVQRSKTLSRKHTKKPLFAKHQVIGHTSPKSMDVMRPQKHPGVKRFAPHPVGAITPKPKSFDVGPVTHPHVAKAHQKSLEKEQALTRSVTASQIKEQALQHAVANTSKKPPLRSRLLPKQRVVAVLSSVFALVLLGGYFTYLNMPSLSVRVAAAQAGIDAGYPNYRPDGYSLNGPVTYSDGRVSMLFKANGGPQAFTLNQQKSGWNSDALLDNYVIPKAGSSYIPYTERGLTIYTFGENAAWVNGGIMYTVEGDAPLSNAQLRRIATSLL